MLPIVVLEVKLKVSEWLALAEPMACEPKFTAPDPV
jgi:hypothetical protein